MLTTTLKADRYAFACFLLGLAVLSYTGSWWPGLLIPVGIALAVRSLLMGRRYDAFLNLLVFAGIFASVQWDWAWVSALFATAGLVLLFQTFLNTPNDEIESEEELEKEIEDR